MARKFACLFYRLIKHGQQYVGQRMEYYEQRHREQQIRSLVKFQQTYRVRNRNPRKQGCRWTVESTVSETAARASAGPLLRMSYQDHRLSAPLGLEDQARWLC